MASKITEKLFRYYLLGSIAFIAATLILATSFVTAQTTDPQTPNTQTTAAPSEVPTPQPTDTPAPLPTATLTADERLTAIERQVQELNAKSQRPPRDWLDILQAWSTIITGGVVVLIGSFLTYWNNQRQRTSDEEHKARELTISRAQIVHTFMPHLLSTDNRQRRTALLALSATGDTILATNLAEIFPDEVGKPVLETLAQSSDPEVATQAKQAQSRIMESDVEKRIVAIIGKFAAQTFSGDLFGVHQTVKLPPMTPNIGLRLDDPVSGKVRRPDIVAIGDWQTWIVEIVGETDTRSALHNITDYYQVAKSTFNTSDLKFWAIFVHPISNHLREELNRRGFYSSTLADVSKLETALGIKPLSE